MNQLIQIWFGGFEWVGKQIAFQTPFEQNYFWMVTLATLFIMGLEVIFPWRKDQAFFRKDWGLDLLYLYGNVFLFAVLLEGIYAALSNAIPIGLQVGFLSDLNWPLQLMVFFIVQDFLQWSTHRLLHANGFLWKFHQIHHSVEEMGVASHFRYHWMENVLYKPTKLATIALFAGVEPQLAVLVHMGTLLIGHLNHANLQLDWGPLRYVLNSPTLHLLHHSKSHLAQGGVNFAISLSCWDHLFGTFAEPVDDGELELGLAGVEAVPSSMHKQLLYPIVK